MCGIQYDRASAGSIRLKEESKLMATIPQIRDAMHRTPFRGFTVRISDGRHLVIRHPDSISLSSIPQGRDLVIHDDQGMHRIDLIQVVEVQEPDPGKLETAETRAEGNGA